jgi:DNA-binding MarR family transcriptional regulator
MNALFHQLKKINGLMFHYLNNTCIKHGLTAKQFLLLRFFYLNQDDKELFQAKIQKDFHVRRSTVTSILQTLEKKGFIIRKTDEGDQRKKVVIMTEQAKDIIKRIDLETQKNDNILLSALTKDEYNTLVGLLNKLCDNLVKSVKYII